MDLVTHDGFPTSTTGRANKENQHLNLFLLVEVEIERESQICFVYCHSVHYFFSFFVFALVPSCHVFV